MRYRRVKEPGATYFFTLVTYQRQRLFSDEGNITRWRKAVASIQSNRPFAVEAEVILPDHIHFMWTLPCKDADYATRIRLIKTKFTKSLPQILSSTSPSRAAKRERHVWQRRYWEHTIRDEQDFANHLDYIHFNPVRHDLVDHASQWPWSSLNNWIERGYYDEHWRRRDMAALPNGTGPD